MQQLTCNIDLSCSFYYFSSLFFSLSQNPLFWRGKSWGKNSKKVRKSILSPHLQHSNAGCRKKRSAKRRSITCPKAVNPRFLSAWLGSTERGLREGFGRKGWQRVGERLAKDWRRVGEGLAGFLAPSMLQCPKRPFRRAGCDSMACFHLWKLFCCFFWHFCHFFRRFSCQTPFAWLLSQQGEEHCMSLLKIAKTDFSREARCSKGGSRSKNLSEVDCPSDPRKRSGALSF